MNHDDVKRLSPLGYDHINIVGHYSFDLPEEILGGKLRPLQPMDKKLFGKKIAIFIIVCDPKGHGCLVGYIPDSLKTKIQEWYSAVKVAGYDSYETAYLVAKEMERNVGVNAGVKSFETRMSFIEIRVSLFSYLPVNR